MRFYDNLRYCKIKIICSLEKMNCVFVTKSFTHDDNLQKLDYQLIAKKTGNQRIFVTTFKKVLLPV